MFSSALWNNTHRPNLRRSSKVRRLFKASWGILLIFLISVTTVHAEDFPKLDEAVPGTFVQRLAPVFDFDGDGCLPSAGISRSGKQNAGLRTTGSITGDCRSSDFLNTSNTLHRHVCMSSNGKQYCAHFYALYFEKDQVLPGWDIFGHRHDWEHVAVWTTDGAITHVSASAHDDMDTRGVASVPFEGEHPKIVYHKDGIGTHAFRFAKNNEVAENPYGRFVTPAITSWNSLRGDGLNNQEMRTRLDTFDYGKATIPMKSSNFFTNVNRFKPSNYPTFQP